MSNEKEIIVEIETEDDARKWIGRKGVLGYRDRGTLNFHGDTAKCALSHTRRTSPRRLEVHTGSDSYTVNTHDIVVFKLTDGAAHPKPEGEGWVWCETAEIALEQFEGQACDVSAGPEPYNGYPRSASGVLRVESVFSRIVQVDGVAIGVDRRGGAWVRPLDALAKSPEQETADAIERELDAAHSMRLDAVQTIAELEPKHESAKAQAARAFSRVDALAAQYLAAQATEGRARAELQRSCTARDEIGDLLQAARQEEEAKAEAEDALFPLPGDWDWGVSDEIAGQHFSPAAPSRTIARSSDGCVNFIVYATLGPDTEIVAADVSDAPATWAHAPFEVYQAVHARHLAEREDGPPTYSVEGCQSGRTPAPRAVAWGTLPDTL